MAEYSTQIYTDLERFLFFEDNTDNEDNVFHVDNQLGLVYINELSVLFILSSKPKNL